MTTESFPLHWPMLQPRTPDHRRRDSKFSTSVGRARDELLRELGLLGATSIVVSTNCPVRRDGLLYADSSEPRDPGVAVYFNRRVGGATRPYTLACDSYRKVRWNLRAVGVTVEALRTIARHGATEMLEQAFTGFAALPPAPTPKAWFDVLGVSQNATLREAKQAYLALIAEHHPDKGGDTAKAAEINAAWTDATKAVTS